MPRRSPFDRVTYPTSHFSHEAHLPNRSRLIRREPQPVGTRQGNKQSLAWRGNKVGLDTPFDLTNKCPRQSPLWQREPTRPSLSKNRCHQLRWRWQRRRVSISSSHIGRGGLRTFVFVVIWKKFVLIDSKYSLSHSGPSTNKWAWVPYFDFVTRTRGIKTERGRRRQIRARARNRGRQIRPTTQSGQHHLTHRFPRIP